MNNADKAAAFIRDYINPETGTSECIFFSELSEKYGESFFTANGGDWCRESSTLGSTYKIVRYKAGELGLTGTVDPIVGKLRSNRNVAIQALGFREKNESNHSIPESVKKNIKGKPCAVLGVVASQMEIDHKNGRYNAEEWAEEDFQPLSKAANDAKREHCKRCRATNKRFRASLLGYPKDFVEGSEEFESCSGCYWYDPFYFNSHIFN